MSHHYRQPKDGNDDDASETAASPTTTTINKAIDHGKDPEIANARSRYMAWYQQKRTEMERKRREKKEAEEEQSRTKWMKRPVVRSRKAKSAEDPDQHKTDAKVYSSKLKPNDYFRRRMSNLIFLNYYPHSADLSIARTSEIIIGSSSKCHNTKS